ncbi:hypothetical protein N9I08_03620 [Candidatus Pelagibacter sp.]|jgi:hypothetical protein|nr:hypothetical protein [Candidatus Pelagibacter sp.]
MRWAIYRIHYGIDFIKFSVNSIINDVDKIFIFYSKEPWLKEKEISYKGKKIPFPSNPEELEKYLVKNFKDNNKIILENFECNTPLNQYGLLFKKAMQICNKIPKTVLFMEPDMLFSKNQLYALNLELKLRFWIKSLTAKQIELWKYDIKNKDTFSYRIPIRKRRAGPVIWKVNNKEEITTNFSGLGNKKNFSLLVSTLNLGFCINKNTMLYKHLLTLSFSKTIGDSPAVENWYEDKWLNWNENTKNLDVSIGNEKSIPKALKYKIPKKFLNLF